MRRNISATRVQSQSTVQSKKGEISIKVMKTSPGPESVRQQRFHRFAIATILAVELLALARPTEAEIVHTKVNVQIPANSSYDLDLNNDGVTDFTISTRYADGPGPVFNESVDETPASGNGAELKSRKLPAELITGDRIGPSQKFYGGTGTMAFFGQGDGTPPSARPQRQWDRLPRGN